MARADVAVLAADILLRGKKEGAAAWRPKSSANSSSTAPCGNRWRRAPSPARGYLCAQKERVVRVRIAGPRAYLTIKGQTDEAITRLEFEYPLPLADATTLLDRLCEKPLVEKTRYKEKIGAHVWEIDVFHGDNDGLIVAEIELSAPDEAFERPAWIGEEVSPTIRAI